MSLVRSGLGYAQRNLVDAAAPATAITAVGAKGESDRRRGNGSGRRIAAGVAAAGAAEVGYRTAGLAVRNKGRALEGPAEGQSRSQYQKLVSQHKHAHGVGGLQGEALRLKLSETPKYYRKYPTALKGWQYKRALGQLSGARGRVLEGALVGGAGLAAMSAKKPVRKSALGALARHGKYGALYGGAIGGAGVGAAHRSNDPVEGFAVVGGAAGAQGAYQGGGRLAALSNDKRARTPKAKARTKAKHGLSNSAQDRLADQHFAQFGLSRKQHKHDAAEAYRAAFRSYPKELPGSKVKRILARTHSGRSGDILGGAVTTAGALGLGGLAHRGAKEKVGKSREYGYRERTLSPVRAVEGTAGVSLLAWGGSRLPLGGAAAYGERLASRHGGGKEVAAALELARSLGAKTRNVTGHGEQLVRGVKSLDRAIERVPANLRPSVAVAAGALLVARARPLHNERFVPEGRLR